MSLGLFPGKLNYPFPRYKLCTPLLVVNEATLFYWNRELRDLCCYLGLTGLFSFTFPSFTFILIAEMGGGRGTERRRGGPRPLLPSPGPQGTGVRGTTVSTLPSVRRCHMPL